MKKLICIFVMTLIIISCSEKNELLNVTDNKSIVISENTLQRVVPPPSTIKIDSIFELIRREFFSQIPSGFDKYKSVIPGEVIKWVKLPDEYNPQTDEIDWINYEIVKLEGDEAFIELPLDEWEEREQLQALIMQAMMTDDFSEVNAYIKEHGLDDVFDELAAKHEVEDAIEDVIDYWIQNSGEITVDFNSHQTGDIFLKFEHLNVTSINSWLGILIPGHWDHSAYFDKGKYLLGDDNYFLSASNATEEHINNQGTVGRSGYEPFTGYWDASTEIAVDKVLKAKQTNGNNSIASMQQYKGIQYSVFTNRPSNNYYYCSKMVYRGWLSEGYELEPYIDSFTGKPWNSLLWIVDWKYKIFLGVKIWYPVFGSLYIKDIFVTPSDLDNDSETYRVRTYIRQ